MDRTTEGLREKRRVLRNEPQFTETCADWEEKEDLAMVFEKD